MKQELEILSVLIFLVIIFVSNLDIFGQTSKRSSRYEQNLLTDGWTGQNTKYHFFKKCGFKFKVEI